MARYDNGRYASRITDQGFALAKTGNTQFVIAFDIIGRVDPKDPNTLIAVPEGNRKIYRAITENTITWILDDLKAMGVEELTSWSLLDPATPGYIDLTGKEIDVNCGTKKGQDGKDYEDWSIAHGSGGGKPIERAEGKAIQNLDRMFGRFLSKPAAAPARRNSPVPQRAPEPVGVGITDDDIPF